MHTRFRIIPLLTVTALIGCGEPGDVLTTRAQSLTEVCGANKYQGPQGVDVSTYQPSYDWVAQANAGVRFGYARVSNGTQIIDDQFDRNWPEMKAQGIYRGVYQYFRPGQDAVAQANLVVDRVGRLGPGDMPAMIDVETNDGQSAAVVAAKVREWIDIVEAGTGKKPAIYTGAYFWQDNVADDSFGEYPLWIANYGAECPLIPDGWTTWTFWQYCDGNTDYCTNGMGFDRDVFNGTDEQLDALAGMGYGGTVVAASSPLQVAAGETVTATIEVQNTGGATWDESTRLGTTNPRDRDSQFASDSWINGGRPSAVAGPVAPGESYVFEFELTAPAAGNYQETFGLVQEGVAWFADQAGPADDIVIEIEVLPEGTVPDVSDPNVTDPTVEEPVPNGTNDPAQDDVLPPTVGPSSGTDGGCSTTSGAPSLPALLLLLAFAATRRRRRLV